MRVSNTFILTVLFFICTPSILEARHPNNRGFHPSLGGASCSSQCRDNHGDSTAAPTDFDMYVLTLSWSASFCYGKKPEQYPGCASPTEQMKAGFTLHGLWPQYVPENQQNHGAAYPVCCQNNDYSDTISFVDVKSEGDLLTKLQQYWPNERSLDPKPAEFPCAIWNHEWMHHGVCTGLSPPKYLKAAIDAFSKVSYDAPSFITNKIGSFIEVEELQQNYQDAFPNMDPVLNCDRRTSSLSAVQFCFDKSLTMISCKGSGLSGCPASLGQIKIPEFPGADGGDDDSNSEDWNSKVEL